MSTPVPEVTAQQVAERLRAGDADLLLLDVREPKELALAQVAGAVHVPMRDVPAQLNRLGPERDIVVMCHHGSRSYNVAHWLRQEAGYERVSNLRGGIDAWSTQVDPTVPRY